MKGSTSLRCFCWLQVNFSHGHCPVAHFGASNGRNWQWQFVDSADGRLWLARALAAKVMFPAPPRAHAPGQMLLFTKVRFGAVR